LSAAAVNARYAYLPTFAAVFGTNAAQQISPSRLRALEQASSGFRHHRERSVASGLAFSRGQVSLLQHGVVVPFTIPATKSYFHARTAEVYLPPAYFESPRPRLPVIELLHGSPGSPADWTRGGFADVTADEYAAQHYGFAPVLVMPDVNGSWSADSECVNGNDGRAQVYLAVDVRNAVIARFHTRRDAGGWAIAGLSEGGYCALQLGLRHPNLYGSIGDFSGERGPLVTGGLSRLFTGTSQEVAHQAAQYDPVNILSGWHGAVRPAIWFEVGSADGNLVNAENLDLLARARGFATRFVVQQGADHSFDSWRQSFHDALPWVVSSFTGASYAPIARRA